MSRWPSLPSLLALLVVGACVSEAPVAPESVSEVDAVNATGLSAGLSIGGIDASEAYSPRYIAAFRGNAPRQLTAIVEAAGGSVDAIYDDYGFAVISGIGDAEISKLEAVNGITEAGVEPLFRLGDPMTAGAHQAEAIASPAVPGAAFFFPIQWHLAAVSAPAAWADGRLGSGEVTVAVLDTGIDPTHADIAGRVDLSRSAVFDHTDEFFIDIVYPGADPIIDIHLHGTHVSSIVSSNAFVGAGVTSQTTLMAVKVCNVTNACPGAATFQGFVHAIENGADVINMSLGGAFDKRQPKEGRSEPNGPAFTAVVNNLFNAAKQAGVTVVVSAGNDAADLDHNGSVFATYCDAPHVICVSATAPASSGNVVFGPWFDIDAPASYTNYGRSAIGVAAPGGDGAGFVVSACSSFSLLIACPGGTFVVLVAGTSQAAPAVSGLAALLVEDYGRNPAKIAAAIRSGADDLGEPGIDPFYGHGRISIPGSLGID